MIAGPSTEKIIHDCARELTQRVLPHLTDAPTIALVAMLDHVLRNAAERCAHEIAWMIEERAQILTLAEEVLARNPRLPGFQEAVANATEPASLNLDDVIDAYRRASEVLSIMLETTIGVDNASQYQAAFNLLLVRTKREKDITLGWGEAEGLGGTR